MPEERELVRQRASRGASSMVSAQFIARLLGIFLVVPMQNLIGDQGLGLYQLVYPLYTIMLTLSTAGFPLALSKTISNLNARGQYREASQTYAIVGRSLLGFGIVAFVLMWFGGPYLLSWSVSSKALLAETVPAIHALAPALLILPLMSAQRGYLQGNLRLEPSAASQVVEQIVRVGVVLAGLLIAVHLGASRASEAAIATFGGTAGAIGGFILLLAAVRKTRRLMVRKRRYLKTKSLHAGTVLRQLFIYALPVALGTLVLPLSQNIDNATVIRQLVAGGMSIGVATGQYGIYAGEALRLMQLPLSFATAIGASIMPAITEARTRGQHQEGRIRFLGALRMTAFITFPVAVTLAALATPLDIALFEHSAGATVFAIAALISIFSALELVTTFILQGYDRFYQPVVHMAIGLAIKLVGNLMLVPILGIEGAGIASVVGYAVSSWLNVAALGKATGQPVRIGSVIWRPAVAMLCTGVWMVLLERLFVPLEQALNAPNSRLLALVFLLVGIGIGGPLYLLAALWVRAIQPSEISRIPVVGRLIARLTARLPHMR